MFPKHAERAIAADEALREAFAAYRELKRLAKETDAALEPLQAQIAAFLGTCDTLVVDDEPALTWRTQVSRRFSESAFKADHPELHAQYVRDLQTRVMRLKGKL